MNTTPTITPFEASLNTASKRLIAFEEAVHEFAKARADLAHLGAVVAKQDGPPEPIQRNRLKALSEEHFTAGEVVKAMAMTLATDSDLMRAARALDDNNGGGDVMAAKLLETVELPIRSIDVSDRLRPVSETAVVSLMASIDEIGLQSEVHVRKVRHQNGKLRLIAGGHRLEAVSRLGATSILAKVWDCTDDWATMAEIDDNLAHTDLAPLDLAVFLATRKSVYERMYPETRSGAFKGNRHTGSLASDILSFTRNVSESRDMSKRQIERLVAAGQALDASAITQLRRAPNRVSLTDLQAIAKCGDPADRKMICKALAEGTAKSAAEALQQKKLKGRPAPVALEPADAEARKIEDAMARASKEGQRRFVRNQADVLRSLLAELDAAKPDEPVVSFASRNRKAS